MDFYFDSARIAERKIQEAAEKGVFDRLPGKGKPLELDDTPLDVRILKKAGVLPDWIQLHKEIRQGRGACTQLWARLESEYPKRRARVEAAPPSGAGSEARAGFGTWHLSLRESYLRALNQVNADILKFNLIAPPLARAHIPYRVVEERDRFDAAFPALSAIRPAEPVPPEKRQGRLRLAARERYRARSTWR